MSTITATVQNAQRRAAEIRPKVGGFPVLAEVLRQAGIHRNEWTLPAAQTLYLTDAGAVVEPATPLISAMSEVPAFDRDAVIDALRADQAGHTTFPQFLTALWTAGVTGITWSISTTAPSLTAGSTTRPTSRATQPSRSDRPA